MLKGAGEAGVDMITDLVNQITAEVVLPVEGEFSTILINCYKRKSDSLKKGNYRGLKLTDQILKMAERIIEKLIRQQVDIEAVQFGFMSGCATTNAIFILRQFQEKYLAKKRRICTLHL